ncbi:MAG: 50S ribosome-binding GTPase [Actinomycetota bacterium]|nr:50S ribosome-binding GTPase [Actinomycetota bacterium]
MSVQAVTAGAKRMLGRGGRSGPGTVERATALQEATTAARGRLDDTVLDRADDVMRRAQERLRLSGEHTVVALAGATGSGKSSLFNRLVGIDLATVGVRRPTTSRTLACTWSPEGADELLGWLGIGDRRQSTQRSALDGTTTTADDGLHGLVLLDLPDHDSTQVDHHVEMARLVEQADLLVWVLDPQKYADAAVHERFLRPMATHAEVMLAVLNHVDALPSAQRDDTLADVRRLLDADGLSAVPLLATSAVTGEGVEELTALLTERVAAKAALRQRLDADVRLAAEAVRAEHGGPDSSDAVTRLDGPDREALARALSAAAGVPTVTRALQRSVMARARQDTGWPPTRWVQRLRRDELRDLRLATADGPAALVRSSLPGASPVQQAGVDTAIRDVADRAAAGLARPWAQAVRRASTSRREDLPAALDQAVVGTDLDLDRRGWWWAPARVLQWLLLACAVVGLVWLLGLAALGWLQLPLPETPDTEGIPTPTLLLVAGALLGIVLAVVCRVAARVSARRRAQVAERAMTASVATVADTHVIAPVQAELERHDRVGAALQVAVGR